MFISNDDQLWPDEKEKRKWSNHGGRRRGIGYDKILELYKNPRVEGLLAAYRSEGSARVALHGLRKKVDMLPPGLWYLHIKEIWGRTFGSDDWIYSVVLGVYFGRLGETDRRMLLNPVRSKLTIVELEELRKIQAYVATLDYVKFEDKIKEQESNG